MSTEIPAPEQRVRDYLEADDSGFDAELLDEIDGRPLNRSDIRDALNELERLRSLIESGRSEIYYRDLNPGSGRMWADGYQPVGITLKRVRRTTIDEEI
jgi:hypothetical protein